ncbi:hypothetical protein ABIF68_006778 [Bradyrhizobium japonicum]
MKATVFLLATMSLLSMSPALAAGSNEQACVLKAADTLPKIAGMKIGKSRTTTMQAPNNWPGSGPPLRVDIEWTAAGQAATWAYLCAVDGAGNARVQRLAN